MTAPGRARFSPPLINPFVMVSPNTSASSAPSTSSTPPATPPEPPANVNAILADIAADNSRTLYIGRRNVEGGGRLHLLADDEPRRAELG